MCSDAGIMAATLRCVFGVLVIITATCLAHSKIAPNLRLNNGIQIPAIALGTWLGNTTKPSGTEVEQAVSSAIEAGYRHIDTAAAYKIEDQVGRALTRKLAEGLKREELFVTTKLWNDAHAKDSVVPALRESLRKLNVDYVDLYLIHWPVGQFQNGTYDSTDYLDTWRGMIDAKTLGLARSIGVSNFNKDQIQRILDNGLEQPSALQVEVNLNIQQKDLIQYCEDHNIVVMGYTPFGSLFPNKAKPDAPPPRVDDKEIKDLAAKYNKTVPQIVLRYLTQLKVIPLPKSLTKSRIEENLDVFDFELSDADKELLQGYDKNYRTIPQYKWLNHPYYPFEKKTD